MCGLSRISYAYLTWVAMWDKFYRQRAYIGITRSCMRWYVRKIESIIGVQWGQKNPKPEGPPFQRETRLVEFPTERWTRGLGFFWNHWTPMIDSFSHIPRPYGTVLCNICWWRHWGRCLQSMTRALQINLKQQINSALNNEQMVISSKWIYKNYTEGLKKRTTC